MDEHPETTIFHELSWKRAVERAFGHRSHFLTALRDGRVVGVLPLFEVRSVIAGTMLISVPYGTYGGILADDANVSRCLLDAAREIGRRVGARAIELRYMKAPWTTTENRKTHATFRKSLPGKADEVPATFPRKARAAARRAAALHHLTVEFADRHLRTVWELYARSMRRLGSPNYPYRFFEELACATPWRHVVQLVCRDGRPVAGLLTLLHRATVMPYFAGMDERVRIYGLGNYLYAESMKWGVRNRFRVYDFGRSRLDNPGSFNFKRFCGFEPTPLEYQSFTLPGRSAPDLSPSSPRWKAARTVWKTLPLSITRPLGGWIARSIPG